MKSADNTFDKHRMSLSVDKALRQAQSHLKAEKLAEAEALYKQVLSNFPKNKKSYSGISKAEGRDHFKRFLKCRTTARTN
jgi:hypothetical protein